MPTFMSDCATNASSSLNSSIVLEMKDSLEVPSFMLLGVSLVLSGIIMLALVLSRCYNFPNSLLYFNISLTDAIMAAAGIAMFLVPTKSATWFNYHQIVIILTGLR